MNDGSSYMNMSGLSLAQRILRLSPQDYMIDRKIDLDNAVPILKMSMPDQTSINPNFPIAYYERIKNPKQNQDMNAFIRSSQVIQNSKGFSQTPTASPNFSFVGSNFIHTPVIPSNSIQAIDTSVYAPLDQNQVLDNQRLDSSVHNENSVTPLPTFNPTTSTIHYLSSQTSPKPLPPGQTSMTRPQTPSFSNRPAMPNPFLNPESDSSDLNDIKARLDEKQIALRQLQNQISFSSQQNQNRRNETENAVWEILSQSQKNADTNVLSALQEQLRKQREDYDRLHVEYMRLLQQKSNGISNSSLLLRSLEDKIAQLEKRLSNSPQSQVPISPIVVTPPVTFQASNNRIASEYNGHPQAITSQSKTIRPSSSSQTSLNPSNSNQNLTSTQKYSPLSSPVSILKTTQETDFNPTVVLPPRTINNSCNSVPFLTRSYSHVPTTTTTDIIPQFVQTFVVPPQIIKSNVYGLPINSQSLPNTTSTPAMIPRLSLSSNRSYVTSPALTPAEFVSTNSRMISNPIRNHTILSERSTPSITKVINDYNRIISPSTTTSATIHQPSFTSYLNPPAQVNSIRYSGRSTSVPVNSTFSHQPRTFSEIEAISKLEDHQNPNKIYENKNDIPSLSPSASANIPSSSFVQSNQTRFTKGNSTFAKTIAGPII